MVEEWRDQWRLERGSLVGVGVGEEVGTFLPLLRPFLLATIRGIKLINIGQAVVYLSNIYDTLHNMHVVRFVDISVHFPRHQYHRFLPPDTFCRLIDFIEDAACKTDVILFFE